MLRFKTKWKSPAQMQIPIEVGKHSLESSSKSVEAKRPAIHHGAPFKKHHGAGKNKYGYERVNHVVCTVFQAPADVMGEQCSRADEPSVVAVSVENIYKEVKLPCVTQNVLLTVASFRTWRGWAKLCCAGLDPNVKNTPSNTS